MPDDWEVINTRNADKIKAELLHYQELAALWKRRYYEMKKVAEEKEKNIESFRDSFGVKPPWMRR